MSTVMFRRRGQERPLPVEADIRSGTVRLDGKNMPLAEARPGVPFPGRVYGVLFNNAAALEEAMPVLNGPPYKGAPEEAVFFFKPGNTLAGYGDALVVPQGETHLRIDAAIGVVIGSFASRLTIANAMDHVQGFTLVCDAGIPSDDYYRHPLKQKCRDGFCPAGPWVVPADAIPDPGNIAFTASVDGTVLFTGNTGAMTRSIPELLVELTAFMSLCPGDVLLTGTSAGAPLATAGSVVRIVAEGIGVLENPVIAGGAS